MPKVKREHLLPPAAFPPELPLEPWGLGSWACPWLSWMDTHTRMHTYSPCTHVCLGFSHAPLTCSGSPSSPLPSLVWLSSWPQLLTRSHQHSRGTCAWSGPSRLKAGNLPWSPPATLEPSNLPALFGLPLKAASCAWLPMASLHSVSKVQGETRDGEEAEQKTLCVYSVSTM